MTEHSKKLPLTLAMGAALGVSLAPLAAQAQVQDSVFGLTELSGGYMQVAAAEGKCGEGKCAANMQMDAPASGDAAADAETPATDAPAEAPAETPVSADDKGASTETKCGENKCGANMDMGTPK